MDARLIHVNSWVQPIQCILVVSGECVFFYLENVTENSAVVKDTLVVGLTEDYFDLQDDEDGNHNTPFKFVILLLSLLLEDIGQIALQVNYYEQFTNKLNFFPLVNATVMVS